MGSEMCIRDRSVPRPGMLGRIAEALDVPVEDLFLVADDQAGLRELRLSAGLTIAQLADAVYVSARTVVRWENGDVRGDISAAHLALLAQALGVPAPRVTEALRASRRHHP